MALKRHSRGATPRAPLAWADGPGGGRTIKVRGKIFVFLSEDGEKLYLTVKLPRPSDAASYRAVAPASLAKKPR